VRLCIIYDCLYPWTIGGAERWYRLLAERMAAHGHHVTYLTRDQWSPGPMPAIPGVHVVAVSGPDALYVDGRRAIAPTLAFGLGVYRRLRRIGGEFDAVACASFPYFSTIAAQRLQPRFGYRLVVDWWEVWSDRYWQDYLGPAGGHAGAWVQRQCAIAPHLARCASDLHARRLAELGHDGPVLPIGGIHESASIQSPPRQAGDYLAVIGRLNRDKGAEAIIPALAAARETLPGLRVVIAGDGPARDVIQRDAERFGLVDAVDVRGFVPEPELDEILRGALALLNLSRREGVGLAVLDAASRGVPSILCAGPDNAAVDLIEPGANGAISPSTAADDVASAILRIHGAGLRLRRSTSLWWAENRARLDAEDGLRRAESALFGPLPLE
jgi:glycosyltransferase involved in cell wall biosynthesis